jgi:hypothetical protein
VSDAGDVNNDGIPDFVVGNSRDGANGYNSGSVRVMSGADGSELFIFNGNNQSDEFGYSVSGAGDVNNDGYDDIIVGAYADDTNSYNSGSATIFSGQDGSILYTFNGDSSYDYFGSSVSGLGDINNDGHDDVIVGAYLDDNNGSNSGSAKIYSGVDGSVLYTLNGDNSDARFGTSVSNVGDLNGDGYPDIIVGGSGTSAADQNAGSVSAFSGVNGELLYSVNGESINDYFGFSVSDVGDINQDGFIDIIVGAYKDDNAGSDSGSASVFSGHDGSLIYQFNGSAEGDLFGYSVSGGGDVNQDGYPDVVIGAPGSNGSLGSVNIYSGIDGSHIITIIGYEKSQRFGSVVSHLSDIDGDGSDDIIVRSSASTRVINNINGDWDNDGVHNFIDPYPLIYTDETSDYDQDGITDVNEPGFGTDFLLSDTDGDGVSDGDEVYVYLSNPLLTDSDSDGIPDGEEVTAGLSPTDPSDVLGDIDGDGLDNLTEFTIGTSINGVDTDGDTLSDFVEYSSPVLDPLLADTDNNGIRDDIDSHPPERIGFFVGYAATSVSSIGDVNNDNVTDILIGNYSDDTKEYNAGVVQVLSGGTGQLLYSIYGETQYQYLGAAVKGVGDVNDDGVPDFIASGSHKVSVYSGLNGDHLYDLSADSGYSTGSYSPQAFSIDNVGDLNNDAVNDIIIGASNINNRSGNVSVFSGIDGQLMYSINGDSSNDYFGFSVGGAGDVNNDGIADFMVGAPSSNNSGSVKVFSGIDGTLLYMLDGDSSNDYFGSSIASAGDTNGDGINDLVIGSRGDSVNSFIGTAKIVSGDDGSLLQTIVSLSASFSEFGRVVKGVGDINNDGYADVVVGAYRNATNGNYSGAVQVFSGSNGSLLKEFYGNGANDQLGLALATGGDIDNNGVSDLILVGKNDDRKNNIKNFGKGLIQVISISP